MTNQNTRSQIVHVFYDDSFLRLSWKDQQESKYSLIWLRDNCPEDRDLRNGQRLVDIIDLPEVPRIKSATVHDESLFIVWFDREAASSFSLEWLRQQSDLLGQSQSCLESPVLWEGDRTHELQRISYSQILSSKQALLRFLQALAQYGIGFLSDVPAEAGEVLKVVELFGYVRETNYGKLFEVRSVSNPNNLAYTDLGLGLHTDNPYRDPVPGLQLLHCLQASLEGGENTFADGFAVAERLRLEAPREFDILTRTPVQFVFQDKSADLRAEWPLIQTNLRGQVIAIQYNNRSMASVSLSPDRMQDFYRAYRLFSKTMKEARFEFCNKMTRGDLVVFDNRRILHGRKAFDANSGPRHLQGCYADRDGLLSRIAVLKREAKT